MRIGSLFSGYGGLDMAALSVFGGQVVWHAEIDKSASRILAYHHPDIPNLGDITTVDWQAVEPVDVLAGGFPCQDVSHAGLRAGIQQHTRSGLWYEFARAIDQLRPKIVVIENVRGLLSADAACDVEPCPWCVGDEPAGHMRALGAVLADLADLGFDAEWGVLPAAAVGAPHRRDRVFIVAADAACERIYRPGVAGPGRWGEPTDSGHSWVEDRTVAALLPTPTASDTRDGTTTRSDAHYNPVTGGCHSMGLNHWAEGAALLPTPATTNGKSGRAMTASTGNGRRTGGGQSSPPGLEEATQLLSGHYPDHMPPPDLLPPATLALLPTPAVNDMGAGKTVDQWDQWTTDMQVKHGNGNGHGKSLSIEAQRLLSTPTAGLGEGGGQRSHRWGEGSQRTHNPVELAADMADGTMADFGPYTAAVERWAAILGRPAPDPTAPGPDGRPRLNPQLVEWMMGLPDGWVTAVPGITRTQALKALGNGVVPQQAAAAIHQLAGRLT